MHKICNAKRVKKLLAKVLIMIKQHKKTFKYLKSLSGTFYSWRAKIASIWHFPKSNEDFHRKMKLIQRAAYGFRNF